LPSLKGKRFANLFKASEPFWVNMTAFDLKSVPVKSATTWWARSYIRVELRDDSELSSFPDIKPKAQFEDVKELVAIDSDVATEHTPFLSLISLFHW